MHRVLWDHDIRHEYHLVRWADHIGASIGARPIEVHRFLAGALAAGRSEERSKGVVFKAPREFTRLRELSRIHMTGVGDVVRVQARIKSLYRSRCPSTHGCAIGTLVGLTCSCLL